MKKVPVGIINMISLSITDLWRNGGWEFTEFTVKNVRLGNNGTLHFNIVDSSLCIHISLFSVKLWSICTGLSKCVGIVHTTLYIKTLYKKVQVT